MDIPNDAQLSWLQLGVHELQRLASYRYLQFQEYVISDHTCDKAGILKGFVFIPREFLY